MKLFQFDLVELNYTFDFNKPKEAHFYNAFQALRKKLS